jgi:NADH:ubiquinone oxidoreductase subunit B-like Fe-S oxidoreductase
MEALGCSKLWAKGTKEKTKKNVDSRYQETGFESEVDDQSPWGKDLSLWGWSLLPVCCSASELLAVASATPTPLI